MSSLKSVLELDDRQARSKIGSLQNKEVKLKAELDTGEADKSIS